MRKQSDHLQFGIWFLFFVTTGFAICFAALRGVAGMYAAPTFRLVFGAYLLAMTVYVLIRFPLLLGRLVRGRRAVMSRRQQLAQWVGKLRADPSERQGNEQ